MKSSEFVRKYGSDEISGDMVHEYGGDMAKAWDDMVRQHDTPWLVWFTTLEGVFSDITLRNLLCRAIREMRIDGGCTIWDLTTDATCRKAIETACAYVAGGATQEELAAACAAAEEVDEVLHKETNRLFALDAASPDNEAQYTASVIAHIACVAAAPAPIAPSLVETLSIIVHTLRQSENSTYSILHMKLAQLISEMGNPFKENEAETTQVVVSN